MRDRRLSLMNKSDGDGVKSTSDVLKIESKQLRKTGFLSISFLYITQSRTHTHTHTFIPGKKMAHSSWSTAPHTLCCICKRSKHGQKRCLCGIFAENRYHCGTSEMVRKFCKGTREDKRRRCGCRHFRNFIVSLPV